VYQPRFGFLLIDLPSFPSSQTTSCSVSPAPGTIGLRATTPRALSSSTRYARLLSLPPSLSLSLSSLLKRSRLSPFPPSLLLFL